MTNAERLQRVCDWLDDHGYTVELDRAEPDWCDTETRVITIDARQTPRSKVLAALHECGHALAVLKLGRGYLFDRTVRGQRGAWARFENELDAWRRGWFLAESLGLGLSARSYELEAARCLATHLPRVCRRSATPRKV